MIVSIDDYMFAIFIKTIMETRKLKHLVKDLIFQLIVILKKLCLNIKLNLLLICKLQSTFIVQVNIDNALLYLFSFF